MLQAMESWEPVKAMNFLIISSIFKLVFLTNDRLDFIVQGLNPKVRICFGKLYWKFSDYLPCNEILIEQECQKLLLVFHKLHLLHIAFKVSINSVLLDEDRLFLKTAVSYNRIRIVIGQKWQKSFSVNDKCR